MGFNIGGTTPPLFQKLGSSFILSPLYPNPNKPLWTTSMLFDNPCEILLSSHSALLLSVGLYMLWNVGCCSLYIFHIVKCYTVNLIWQCHMGPQNSINMVGPQCFVKEFATDSIIGNHIHPSVTQKHSWTKNMDLWYWLHAIIISKEILDTKTCCGGDAAMCKRFEFKTQLGQPCTGNQGAGRRGPVNC